MAVEVERKFLVKKLPPEVQASPSHDIRQGYLAIGANGDEVRIRERDGRCTLTVKSGRGIERTESEIEITGAQFNVLWDATKGRRVAKRRYLVQAHQHIFEVDVYSQPTVPSPVVEVEFPDRASGQNFVPPNWFGEEVTGDRRYLNQTLAQHGIQESESTA